MDSFVGSIRTASPARRYRPGGDYPRRSTARSSLPGSLWWIQFPTGGGAPVVKVTQWDALVRRFQQKARALLPYAYLFPSDGDCGGFISNATSLITGGGRLREALSTDGIWGPETSDALGALLCMYGQTTLAQRLAVNARQGQSTPSTPIPLDTLVPLAFFALNVQTIRQGEAPTTIPPNLSLNNVRFPADTLLPLWSTRVRSAEPNREWIGSFPLDGTSQAEQAPADLRGQTTDAHADEPQPNTTDTNLLNQAGVNAPPPGGNTTTTTNSTSSTTAQGAGGLPLWAWLGLAVVGVVVIGGVAYAVMADGSRVPVRELPPSARVEVMGYRANAPRQPPRQLPARTARAGTTTIRIR